MGYDGRLLRLAQERLEAERTARQQQRQARLQAIYDRQPRLREIQQRLQGTAGHIVAAALRRGEDPRPRLKELREENMALQAERRALLEQLGLPEDALEDTPACALCGDTGYRGGAVCRCLERRYAQQQQRALSQLLDLGRQSFDTFSSQWYDPQRQQGNSKSAREQMEWVYDCCVEYAHSFGRRSGSLLLFGGPGLGKTHLSAAIAREVGERGFSVVYDTAAHIFQEFEDWKFGREEDRRAVDRVMECDLLIMDDLGTEMVTEFVSSALYRIVNGRLLERRSTVVSTNLMPDAIARRYSPQIASRLEGEYRLLAFVGEDIRKKKNARREE